MRDLGDCEHGHQVEQQFGIGDAAALVRLERAEQRAAGIIARHRFPAPAAWLPQNGLAFRHPGLQGQRVQHTAHLATQRLVDDLVLLDA